MGARGAHCACEVRMRARGERSECVYDVVPMRRWDGTGRRSGFLCAGLFRGCAARDARTGL